MSATTPPITAHPAKHGARADSRRARGGAEEPAVWVAEVGDDRPTAVVRRTLGSRVVVEPVMGRASWAPRPLERRRPPRPPWADEEELTEPEAPAGATNVPVVATIVDLGALERTVGVIRRPDGLVTFG